MKKLITSDEARQAPKQHEKPCSDCPWARSAINGWLGSMTKEEWVEIAHTDTLVECHAINNQQCAGLAIYRRNVCKLPRPPILVLESNREIVFANRQEFLDHHSKVPKKKR